MKSFFWVIYYCIMVMFFNIYVMEKRCSLPKTHSLTYILAEVDKDADEDTKKKQQKEREKIGWEILLDRGTIFFDYTMIRAYRHLS